MNIKTSVTVDGQIINVNSQLLFQRVHYSRKWRIPNGLPWEAGKFVISDTIWGIVQMLCVTPFFVLDGGSLFQRLPWTKDASFSTRYSSYFEYVKQK